MVTLLVRNLKVCTVASVVMSSTVCFWPESGVRRPVFCSVELLSYDLIILTDIINRLLIIHRPEADTWSFFAII